MPTPTFCAWHRVPRAGIDPITTAGDALSVFNLAVKRPLVDETIVLVLDDTWCGRSVISVDGTDDPEAVVTILDYLVNAAHAADGVAAFVVASIRPGEPATVADIDRWLEASELCERYGIELVEWFVMSGDGPPHGVACPRDLLGERPRW